MNEKPVNKGRPAAPPLVPPSNLGWMDLTSIEKTATMDVVRTLDDLRRRAKLNGYEITLEECLRELRAGLTRPTPT